MTFNLDNPAIRKQPSPVWNTNPSIQSLVIEDMKVRMEKCSQDHQTVLQAFNGRNALEEAYQESLDLPNYLRQQIEEQTKVKASIAKVFEFAAILEESDHYKDAQNLLGAIQELKEVCENWG